MVERYQWLCATYIRRDGLIIELFHRYILSQGILLYLQDSKLRSERKRNSCQGTVCRQGTGMELGPVDKWLALQCKSLFKAWCLFLRHIHTWFTELLLASVSLLCVVGKWCCYLSATTTMANTTRKLQEQGSQQITWPASRCSSVQTCFLGADYSEIIWDGTGGRTRSQGAGPGSELGDR